MTQTLADWLERIESKHPVEIELGLERVSEVAGRLKLDKPAPIVISVAGTNGKGSCVAIMDCLLREAGLKTAVYTSPHLVRFNERLVIRGREAQDRDFCHAFELVQQAQDSTPQISLTYFEFTTLAAFLLIAQSGVDVALLEIGLGGRLDAVNIIDADIAVVTSVALDHEGWLGTDLDDIGKEKAGIARPGKPFVYGDLVPVQGVLDCLAAIGAKTYLNGTDFLFDEIVFTSFEKKCQTPGVEINLPQKLTFAPASTACALQALTLLGIKPDQSSLEKLGSMIIPGRYQRLDYRGKSLLLDVAHNPAAAERLAAMIRREQPSGCVIAVFAVMADKDAEGIVTPMKDLVRFWVLPQLANSTRALKPESLETLLYNAKRVSSVGEAMTTAFTMAHKDDLVVVFGSFYLVGPVLEWLQAHSEQQGALG